MAEPRSGIGALVARALEADARYYEAMGRLTSTWLRELAAVGAELRLPRVTAAVTPAASAAAGSVPAPVPATEPTAARPPDSGAAAPARAALVLEAAGGQEATGAFLVENTLTHRVEHAVAAGPLTGPAGQAAPVDLRLQPDAVALDPGEQAVVKVTTVVPPTLVGEHRGTVRVAAVPGAEMPILVRRAEA